MGQVTCSASPRERAIQFIRAYQAAPPDADIDVHVGEAADDGTVKCVCISINEKPYPLLVTEARILADIFAESLAMFGKAAEAEGLPNIIMALRYAADTAEKPTPTPGGAG